MVVKLAPFDRGLFLILLLFAGDFVQIPMAKADNTKVMWVKINGLTEITFSKHHFDRLMVS
jgi:hypothetical protein